MNTKDRMKAMNIMIGILLKESRLEKGLTQEQVGQKVNLTREAISQYEHGKRSINLTDFFDMCDKCGFNADSILDSVRNASDYELSKLLKFHKS